MWNTLALGQAGLPIIPSLSFPSWAPDLPASPGGLPGRSTELGCSFKLQAVICRVLAHLAALGWKLQMSVGSPCPRCAWPMGGVYQSCVCPGDYF